MTQEGLGVPEVERLPGAELLLLTIGDEPTATGTGWLDAFERRRLEALPAGRPRQRFLALRWTLRLALAQYLTGDPREIAFDAPRGAKPRIASANLDGLRFNLSHAGDRLAVMVSFTGEPGVDLERVQPERDRLALARRVFAPSETAWLATLSPMARAEGFVQLWTLKEAMLKGLGLGLAGGLSNCVFEMGQGEPRLISAPGGAPEAWRVTAFHLAAGYRCAMALGPANS